MQAIENSFHTNTPTWPSERTLITTGLLDALLRSKSKRGEIIETPHLAIPYKSDWSWKEPPALRKEHLGTNSDPPLSLGQVDGRTLVSEASLEVAHVGSPKVLLRQVDFLHHDLVLSSGSYA